MTEAKHTKGPWIWDQQGEQIHSSDAEVIVYELGTNEANNRLIAAAPDLLAALQFIDLTCGLTQTATKRLHAAIAKATGSEAA